MRRLASLNLEMRSRNTLFLRFSSSFPRSSSSGIFIEASSSDSEASPDSALPWGGSGNVDGWAHHGAVPASPVGMLSLAVFHMDRTSFERWSTLFTFRETLEAGMSSARAEFVHLLRGSRNATKVWCSEQAAESGTGSVDAATRAACLRTALDHYAVRHEVSWLQIQRIMDRQVVIMEKVDPWRGEIHLLHSVS